MTDLATAGRRRLLDTLQHEDDGSRARALYLLIALLVLVFILLSIAVVGRHPTKARAAAAPALPPCPEQR
jgi:hypothetical protein